MSAASLQENKLAESIIRSLCKLIRNLEGPGINSSNFRYGNNGRYVFDDINPELGLTKLVVEVSLLGKKLSIGGNGSEDYTREIYSLNMLIAEAVGVCKSWVKDPKIEKPVAKITTSYPQCLEIEINDLKKFAEAINVVARGMHGFSPIDTGVSRA